MPHAVFNNVADEKFNKKTVFVTLYWFDWYLCYEMWNNSRRKRDICFTWDFQMKLHFKMKGTFNLFFYSGCIFSYSIVQRYF